MDFDIYWITLLTLLPSVIILTGRSLFLKIFRHVQTRWRRLRQSERLYGAGGKYEWCSTLLSETETARDTGPPPPPPCSQDEEIARFNQTYLSIYLLVMSSEWLSGPYLYTLLRDDRGLPEPTVCALYATAYTSAAVSALVTGFLADRYGRRKACLAECAIHSAACLTVIFGGDSLPVLFLGRVLAGTALTLLWTVFESWMVTEWNARGLGGEDGSGGGGMSGMFGMMTTANCMTAIAGGVLGHGMVSVLGSKLWPFGTGIVMEAVAAVLMLRNMNENYGVKLEERDDTTAAAPELSGRGRLGDSRIWALTLVTCLFEGTNFLVIFFWPSVLQDAHNSTLEPGTDVYHRQVHDIPYGVIFASFMAAMIFGALLFSACSRSKIFQHAGDLAVLYPVCLLIVAVVIAGFSLLCLAAARGEVAQFSAFLVFEVANGVYIPSMAYIRGLVVDDKSRTGLYGLMKIPLFIFVILALGITAEDNSSRRFIFAGASCCLFLAVMVLGFGFLETINPPKSTSNLTPEDSETPAAPLMGCGQVPRIIIDDVGDDKPECSEGR